MTAPTRKTTVNPKRDRLRPSLSFATEANMAPKKQPAGKASGHVAGRPRKSAGG